MRETVCIHVGQCGNQIGNQFWNQLLHEHENTPDNDESLSAFFRFSQQRNGTVAMKARALLIDMECGPLQETMKGPLGALFDDTQFVMDVYGSGNNFAQGHYMYGPQYRERFSEGVRKNAEHCDSLQTFLVTHSLGGGTGSGVGTYMLGLLSDEYPKICRFSTCVYPSENNDVVTSPYNVMLATSELIEHADCVFPLDNSALFAFSQREHSGKKGGASNKDDAVPFTGNTMNSNTHKSKDRGFDAINGVAARMLCHLTSSSRFHGEMNVDLNEIYTNLIPYPRLHFLITALSLHQAQQPAPLSHAKPVSGKAKGAIGNSGSAEVSAGRHGARAALQRAFGDVLAERGQIAAALPVQIPSPQPMAPSHASTTAYSSAYDCNTAGAGAGLGPVTLASAFLARGRGDSVPLTDFLDCVTNAQKSLRFPHWNQNACKIGMCGTPSPGEQMSVLAVYNSTSFGSVLSREMKGFQRLYRKKAMLHHYTEYVAESAVAEAEQVTESVLEEYRCLESRGSISQQHRDRLRQRKAALSTGAVSSGAAGAGGVGSDQRAGSGSRGTGAGSGAGYGAGAGAGFGIQQSFFDPQLTARPVQLFPAF